MQQRKSEILLVYPPITKLERYSSAIGASGGQQIPLGIFYLASYLRSKSVEADVVDAEAMALTNADIIERLRCGEFGVLGITAGIEFWQA